MMVGEVQKVVQGAIQLHQSGKLEEAADIYDQLLARLTEDDPSLLNCYGTLLAQRGQYGLAVQLLEKCVAAAPEFAWAWGNLGTAYRSVERYQDAIIAHGKALELEPNNPAMLTNMAGAHINRNSAKKAEEYARKAIAADDNFADGHVHLALSLLEQGRFDEAWPHYESRWRMDAHKMDARPYKAPRWSGERVNKLAIHGEQGLGDEIMFMACYREAAKRADHIAIECAGRLVPLFQRSFGPKAQCYPDHASLIAAEGEPDAYVPMGSLPSVVGLPMDGRLYLKRAEALRPKARPLIGLSWRGGTQRTNHTLRSMPLHLWAPILCTRNADFISLQYGPDDVDEEARMNDIATLPDREFMTIADALSQCDLVITVCQTNVHLAGAFGIPCFVLTPEKSAWRYCRDRMEWYDSVSLFKKKDGQKWSEVIGRVAIAANMRFADAA